MTNATNDHNEARSIFVESFLPYAPARVWKALTSPEMLARWLMPNDFTLELGHEFTFHTDPIPATNFDGTIYCEVLAFEPERRLHISWNSHGDHGITTTVTWQLEPVEGGTAFTLLHEGFDPANPTDQIARKGMSAGWERLPQRLNEVIAEASE